MAKVPRKLPRLVTKPVQETLVQDTQKEVVPSKTGVLKKTKKPAQRPRHSLERRSNVKKVHEKSISSFKRAFMSRSNRILKPQLSRKGVTIREIPAPISGFEENKS